MKGINQDNLSECHAGLMAAASFLETGILGNFKLGDSPQSTLSRMYLIGLRKNSDKQRLFHSI